MKNPVRRSKKLVAHDQERARGPGIGPVPKAFTGYGVEVFGKSGGTDHFREPGDCIPDQFCFSAPGQPIVWAGFTVKRKQWKKNANCMSNVQRRTSQSQKHRKRNTSPWVNTQKTMICRRCFLMNDNNKTGRKNNSSNGLPIGMCIGIVIGTAVGAATHNFGAWVPIGLCLGLALAPALGHKNTEDN